MTAGLFIRGLYDLNTRRAGWESDRLVTGSYRLPAASYPSADEITAFQRRAVERLESLPGVASVGIASFTPFFSWQDSRSRTIVAGLPGMRTDSPGILLATTLLLVAIALVACWLPARRAGRIDAILALRAE